MATREIIVLSCDCCDSEDMVDTHTMTIDGQSVEAEVCAKCWERLMGAFAGIAKNGRRIKPARVKKADVLPFPGEAWKFSAHALVRMGERHLDPSKVAEAAEDPTTTHPGLTKGLEVRIRGNIKVVVQPKSRTIITAGGRDEEIENVA